MSALISENTPEEKILWIFVKVSKEKISTHIHTHKDWKKNQQMFSRLRSWMIFISFITKLFV